MSEREEAVQALEAMRRWASADLMNKGPTSKPGDTLADHESAWNLITTWEARLRAAIDKAYPPDDDEDADPVGSNAGERWIIELQSKSGEWAQVEIEGRHNFPSKPAAQEWARHMPSARVRRVDGDDGE